MQSKSEPLEQCAKCNKWLVKRVIKRHMKIKHRVLVAQARNPPQQVIITPVAALGVQRVYGSNADDRQKLSANYPHVGEEHQVNFED